MIDGSTPNTTLFIKFEGSRKMRVASRHWEEVEVTGKNEMLEVRNVDTRLDVARLERKADEWDPPVEAYDTYASGDE